MKVGPTSHAARVAAVEEALNRLPVLDDDRRRLVGQYATSLVFAGDITRGWPRKRVRQCDLLQLEKLTGKLLTHIQTLNGKVASGKKGRAALEHATDLEPRLGELARRAREAVKDVSPAKRNGAPQKTHAAIVRERAAEIFEFLTGRETTATVGNDHGHNLSGLWPAFLDDVYAALGVSASASSQAHVRAKGKNVRKVSR